MNPHVATPSRLLADIRFGVWTGFAPPTKYSDILSATPMVITPAEQESETLIAANASNQGEVIDSGQNPTGKPSGVKLTAATMTPIMRALALGATVSEVTQSAEAIVGEAVTLALYSHTKLDYSDIAAHGTGTEIVLGTRATLTTGTEGSNNAITWTAVPVGADGNDITITIVDPVGNDGALSVAVTDTDIVITAATNGSSAITSTPAQIIAAAAASEAVSALVTGANAGTSDGTGVVTAVSETALSGGTTIASTKYEIDRVGGYIKPLHADAVGSKFISYHTVAGTFESYAAGGATSEYVHLACMVKDQASDTWAPCDIWRVRLAATGEWDPTSGKFSNVELEGDMVMPKDANGNWITIGGRTPSSAWEYRRKTA